MSAALDVSVRTQPTTGRRRGVPVVICIAFVIVTIVGIWTLVGPHIAPYDPNEQSLSLGIRPRVRPTHWVPTTSAATCFRVSWSVPAPVSSVRS